ncbi:winged helix-turn-helix transcriptional regulator [Arthrobacter sp. JUb115]|uniref:winged helix-turn-helix transcriptional regulator n=1 Tax=Arthrobacter sp. JUb115 TaxID=2485108 RepID=UPI002570E0DA|nr:winged helix-turn-helix transcriptional regulator [Arthrobacter sp. JUb115]
MGLTPAPCLRRVQRLEESGVISGYYAAIDPVASGRGFCVVMSIEITMTDRDTVENFESSVAALEEVPEVRRVYGFLIISLLFTFQTATPTNVFRLKR